MFDQIQAEVPDPVEEEKKGLKRMQTIVERYVNEMMDPESIQQEERVD